MELFNDRSLTEYLSHEKALCKEYTFQYLLTFSNSKGKEDIIKELIDRYEHKGIVFRLKENAYDKIEKSSGWEFSQTIEISNGYDLLFMEPNPVQHVDGSYSVDVVPLNGVYKIKVSLEYSYAQVASLKKQSLLDFFAKFDQIFSQNVGFVNSQISSFNEEIKGEIEEKVNSYFAEKESASQAAKNL